MINDVNALGIMYPKLKDEWNYEKNKGIDLNSLSCGSNKKVWWKCNICEGEWEASIYHRTKGNNCPYCANKKLLKGFNDLQTKHPELAEEWDCEKNEISPEEIIAGSNKDFWWKCPDCDFSYLTSPNKRIYRPRKCPNCVKKENEKNLIVNKCPELLDEWNYELNKGIDEKSLTFGSHTKVWWTCSYCGQVYARTVKQQYMSGKGCKSCNHAFSAKNVVAQKIDNGISKPLSSYTEIMKFWDYENNAINPDEVTINSNKEAYWKCEKGHQWKTLIQSMTERGNGCPICNGERKTSFPEQSIVYYLSKFFNVDSRKRIAGWEVDVFLPDYNIGVEYDGMAYHTEDKLEREGRKNKALADNGVDLIRIKESKDRNDTNGNIIYYNPGRNNSNLAYGLAKVISMISQKTNTNYDYDINITRDKYCIFAQYKSLEVENSIASLYPDIAKEFDIEANYPITPEMVSFGSTEKYQWKCIKCGFTWIDSPNQRTSKKTGCSNCRKNMSVKEKLDVGIMKKISLTHPWLIKEWKREKNDGFELDDFDRRSDYEATWYCEIHDFYYKKKVIYRVMNGNGCPKCGDIQRLRQNHQTKLLKNSFEEHYPELLKEWDYGSNKRLPSDYTRGTKEMVNWVCSKGHRYTASILARVNGGGCPYCSNHKVLKGFNDVATTNPEILKEWSSDEISPFDFTAGSGELVDWRCELCGHKWSEKIQNRTKLNSALCPVCFPKTDGNKVVVQITNDGKIIEHSSLLQATKNTGLKKIEIFQAIKKGGITEDQSKWAYMIDNEKLLKEH